MKKIKTWQERTGNHNIRPGSVKHMIAEIAELRAELATRCRAEGGDGAPEAVDVSADRAQQGDPVDISSLVKWGAGMIAVGWQEDKELYVKVSDLERATKTASPADAHSRDCGNRGCTGCTDPTDLARELGIAAPVSDTGIPTAGEAPAQPGKEEGI